MQRSFAWLGLIILIAAACKLQAGGSGLNIVVILNQNSTNSLQLANAYCEQRGVPPQNVLRLTNQWSGGSISCTADEFTNSLQGPLLDMIRRRNLTNQIQFILLSMDLPYQVIGTNGLNSTPAALFYGFKPDTAPVAGIASCSLPDNSSNSYAFSEQPFAPPNTAMTNSFLAVMLTDTSLAGAQLILNRGVASDASYPPQPVLLAKTTDPARNVRYAEFDDAIFATRVNDGYSMIRTNTDSTGFTNLLGLQTGLANLLLATNAFIPGALGDSLTSYGGGLFQPSGQTPLLAFLDAGAVGSYGTVIEPCNYLQKFPHPLNYFYQSRGFSLAEAYYQSLANPYQGLIVGEPLSAPFARHALAVWNQLPPTNAVLTSQTNLQLGFTAGASNCPIGQVDLFIDGTWFKTVTNLLPASGDVLSFDLAGTPFSYTVPANATIISTAAGLASAINSASNATHVAAFVFGDRIELRLLEPNTPGTNVTLNIGASQPLTNSTSLLLSSRSSFLDSIASGYRYFLVSNAPVAGDWLQLVVTKTNGVSVTVAVTNNLSGTTIGQLVLDLVNQVNATSTLQAADGVTISDYTDYTPDGIAASDFFIYARGSGWPAARIQTALTASTNLVVSPSIADFLQDNLADLQPRNHLYLAAGTFSLTALTALDTAQLPDGYHDLTMVGYEGTSVRTQASITRNVRVENGNLSASLNTLFGGPNSDLNSTLAFAVVSNTNTVRSTELFTTGGSIGVVSNQATAYFSIAGTNLGLGRHPFYALVTDSNGKQFRTRTTWIRLLGPEPPFSISASARPTKLSWPATAGRSYSLLLATNLPGPFSAVATVIPTNSTATWVDTNSLPKTFYRVHTAN